MRLCRHPGLPESSLFACVITSLVSGAGSDFALLHLICGDFASYVKKKRSALNALLSPNGKANTLLNSFGIKIAVSRQIIWKAQNNLINFGDATVSLR